MDAIINIGYLIGLSKKRTTKRKMHNEIRKLDIKILKSEFRKANPKIKGDEDTQVIKIDRVLTKDEILQLCRRLGQYAIPQLHDEGGDLWGPVQRKVDKYYGGKFNIDYFKLFSAEDAETFAAEFEEKLCGNCDGHIELGMGSTIPPYHSPHTIWCESCYDHHFDAESFDANWDGVSNMPGHPLNPSRPSDDRGDRLKPRRPIRRPNRRPFGAEIMGYEVDNKTIGIAAVIGIIGGWFIARR